MVVDFLLEVVGTGEVLDEKDHGPPEVLIDGGRPIVELCEVVPDGLLRREHVHVDLLAVFRGGHRPGCVLLDVQLDLVCLRQALVQSLDSLVHDICVIQFVPHVTLLRLFFLCLSKATTQTTVTSITGKAEILRHLEATAHPV